MPRHAFRLPSLHRLNTKDLAAPPTAISTSPPASGYQPLATPPGQTSSHHHSLSTDSTTLSPSSTTSSVQSASSFTTATSNNSASSSHTRIRNLLALRRKQSRINIEREIADEQARFGSPGNGGLLSVMEPRPGVARDVGGAGGVVMGGIFEVLGGNR